jgi:hypothetical protein
MRRTDRGGAGTSVRVLPHRVRDRRATACPLGGDADLELADRVPAARRVYFVGSQESEPESLHDYGRRNRGLFPC